MAAKTTTLGKYFSRSLGRLLQFLSSDLVRTLEVAVGATLRFKITTSQQPPQNVLELMLTDYLSSKQEFSHLSSLTNYIDATWQSAKVFIIGILLHQNTIGIINIIDA